MRPSQQIATTIRQLAKRGTNAKLLEALNKIYLAGLEEGMRLLQNELKERINVNQSLNNSASIDGERKQPDRD
jgi:hypothetical protein